ncbi:hypothetical protein STEG23_030793 [Scotinomys teguina]
MRTRADGAAKEGAGGAGLDGAPETRAKPTVRVRLEDRFNSMPVEPSAPRGAEPGESGVALNNLVTLIRHPSELMNVPLHQQQNKCTTLVKNKTAAATTALQFTYPLFTSACSTGGNASLAQTQSSSNSCSILEAAKHQDIGLPRAFSFCYQQEIESTKQTGGSRNKALPEQVWIKVGEEALCKQAINKRNRSRIRQLDTSVERRALGEIQNVGESSTASQGTWQSSESSQSNLGEQTQSGPQGGRSQRRERHNRMERDRSTTVSHTLICINQKLYCVYDEKCGPLNFILYDLIQVQSLLQNRPIPGQSAEQPRHGDQVTGLTQDLRENCRSFGIIRMPAIPELSSEASRGMQLQLVGLQ